MEKSEKPTINDKTCELVNLNTNSQVHNSPGHQLTKPKSAGNNGFKRHNRRKFQKTERMRILNKKR